MKTHEGLLGLNSSTPRTGVHDRLTVQGCLAILVAAGFWVAVQGPVLAQAPMPDYSSGVKKFISLGLPDVQKARYVKIESQYGGMGMDRFAGQGPKLVGNAWLLEEKTDGTSTVVVEQLKIAELVSPKVLEKRMKDRMERMKAKMKGREPTDDDDDNTVDGMEPDEMDMFGFGQGGICKEVDLKVDIQTLTDYLEKVTPDRDYEFKQRAPDYFLFAAHVHNRGLTAEANKIIFLLFQKAGDSRKLLSSAMNKMAESQYDEAYKAFGKTGDWQQYLSGMEGLVTRFSTAWRNGPVVEKVAAMVRVRIGAKEPPAIAGDGLTDEDRKIAELLGRATGVISLSHPVFNGIYWLAPEKAPKRKAANPAPVGPFDLIRERGVQSIPFLTAMLRDNYLVRTGRGGSYSFSSFDMDDEPLSQEEIDQRLESMARPMTRGEIAYRILGSLIMTRDDEARFNPEKKPTMDEVGKKAMAWFEAHKNTPREGLFRQLLGEDREEVLGMLLGSKAAEDRRAVEAHMLSTKRLAASLSSAVQYAGIQGPDATPFVKEYLAELKKLPSLVPKDRNMPSDPRYLKMQEEQARTQVTALEEMISDKSAEQTLKEMVASDKKWSPSEVRKNLMILQTKLAHEDPDKGLTMLLQACVDARDDRLAATLLQSIMYLRYGEMQRAATAGDTPPKPHEYKVATHAELWKRVLAQERKDAGEGGLGMMGGRVSFQQQAGMAVEQLYGKVENELGGGEESMMYLGTHLYDFYLHRAQARLAGKSEADLPGFPDKTKVTKERKDQIHTLLLESAAEKQHEIASQLSLDELVAIPEMVTEDPRLNEKVVAASHIIRKVEISITNDPMAKLCEPMKGKAIDKKALESLIAECKRQVALGSNIVVSLERAVPLAGTVLTVSGRPGSGFLDPGEEFAERSGSHASVMANIQCMDGERIGGYVQWPVKMTVAVAAVKPGAGKAADDDLLPAETGGGSEEFNKEQEEEFWKSLDKLLDPKLSACAPYSCNINAQAGR